LPKSPALPDYPFTTTSESSGRVHRRRLLNIPAEVALSASQSFAVRLLDVSEGGAGIVAPAAAPSGLKFTLRFQLPERVGMAATPVELQSRVVHSVLSRDSAGFRIGVQFLALRDEEIQRLRSYVNG
jgi:c-di-GMP-binding flagellar brake protein YcgR